MIHFLSDLHLSPETPDITRLFAAYLAGEARTAKRIFILGDLFEAWPGDDAIDDPEDPFAGQIVAHLSALARSGTRVSVMHGNRDFLLGHEFSTRSGAELLPDPYALSSPDGQFVLTHGDALCTDDSAYQAFRTQVRSPEWQAAFLARPLEERKAIASALREQSEASKRGKAMQAMDLTPAATDNFLRQNGYATLIHGHTHRPARHDHTVDGIHVERWVLADWHDGRGEYLLLDGQHLSRHELR
ncbi:UDP-2,3-diacylglucosamine diphosphatase [Propionivibrio sp.]|uniref:UDP-2,3-diacylglucosamine diphosphatase n=1 Tax=Propionivibrio sp. TaxID=2212460 RepID=UPI00272EB5C3|nr:UDP-2,3-diacylglucosamine diphosphatase [Propionivibrio sp.]